MWWAKCANDELAMGFYFRLNTIMTMWLSAEYIRSIFVLVSAEHFARFIIFIINTLESRRGVATHMPMCVCWMAEHMLLNHHNRSRRNWDELNYGVFCTESAAVVWLRFAEPSAFGFCAMAAVFGIITSDSDGAMPSAIVDAVQQFCRLSLNRRVQCAHKKKKPSS